MRENRREGKCQASLKPENVITKKRNKHIKTNKTSSLLDLSIFCFIISIVRFNAFFSSSTFFTL